MALFRILFFIPVVTSITVISFLWNWNDFLWPLVVIQSENHMTLQLGLSTFQGAHSTAWTLLMAGNVPGLARRERA